MRRRSKVFIHFPRVRPSRIIGSPNAIRSRRVIGSPKSLGQRFEQFLIRLVILASVLLVVAQIGLGLAKDPVDFYIAMAQKVEAPSLELAPVTGTVAPELNQERSSGKTYKVTLKATPAAPVKVVQNSRVIGTLTRGELEIPVQAGTVQLDGTNVSQIVRVQVTKRDAQLHDPRPNQSFIIEHNVQTMRVAP